MVQPKRMPKVSVDRTGDLEIMNIWFSEIKDSITHKIIKNILITYSPTLNNLLSLRKLLDPVNLDAIGEIG
jgi:hypothetical protein